MKNLLFLLLMEDKLTYQGDLTWKLLELKDQQSVFYWQPIHKDSIFLKPHADWDELASAARSQSGDCPEGMVRVKGNMLSALLSVPLQNKACLDGPKWKPGYLCQKFGSNYLDGQNISSTAQDFCIDAFEFPNIPGEFPVVMASYDDAKALCVAQDKRLCGEEEWSFACESEKALPYPQGFNRYTDLTSSFPANIKNPDGCNYDRLPSRPINEKNLVLNARNAKGAFELDRSFNGTRAGDQSACKSEYGVYDLTGNVEEWTARSVGRASILKGGYWAPVRARCRLSEDAHGPQHKYYQTGFRCCF
ncbi:MAG TPA: SUMF1/EgtB/PvdO family nonheme iron enzyme [Bacteriovoracaceae bacterium]|nr:SUMF1/EgtB/PvdO family nonheme iron enzyme [Bacteriovoracaceae bacterium]